MEKSLELEMENTNKPWIEQKQDSEISEEGDNYSAQSVLLDEHKRLRFASQVLIGVAVIFIASMVIVLADPRDGGTIFDACKTIIPSIVTLILGYYFGQK